MTGLIIFLIVLLAIIVSAAIIGFTLTSRAKKAAAALDDAIADRPLEIRAPANFFGIKSRGATQVRGNGHLALTEDELVFAKMLPLEIIRIPRAQISGTETTRSFLGKTVGRELLVVRYADDEEIAFLVRDLPRWRAALA